MAITYILLAAAGLLVYFVVSNVLGLRKHIAMAKESGFPYVIVPVYTFSRTWLLLVGPVTYLAKKLPESLRPAWIQHVSPDQSWDLLFSQFDRSESKTYLIVSPGAITGWTANAEAINTITLKRNEFPKPTHLYRALDIYGKNIVSTEGNHWRRQRKITSPSFSEKNNYLVWNESILQTESMLKDWTGMDGNSSRTVTTVAADCMRLSLHVISRAGFGISLKWPGVEVDPNAEEQKPKAGHTLTFTDALGGLLHNLLFIIGVPHKLLNILPFRATKHAWESFTEWTKYMIEMREEKKIELSSGDAEEGMDLMGALVRNAGYGPGGKSEKDGEYLTDEEVIANAFVFILAGHETTANVIHFALALLAIKPEEQRKLQKEVDSIFHGKKSSEWDYDVYLPQLFGGYVGAVMNETLRVIPPALNVPKYTHEWQPITIDGKQYKFPPKTMINLTVSAVHRNPKYWPHGPGLPQGEEWHPTSNHGNDLNEFRPARWLLNEENKTPEAMPSRDLSNTEAEDLGVNTAADTSEALFKPMKGSYIPFSEGFRSCIGRRFAQVEVLVVIARIFSEYSVELALDQYASMEELATMSEAQKKEIWKKARKEARETLRTKMGTIITLQLRSGAYIPLRFVRRGKENFNF